jgi:hypothetical protein
MFWLACAAYRLARFNVTIDPLADKRYFVGLPSPGAAGVVIATVLAIDGPLYDWTLILPAAVGVVPDGREPFGVTLLGATKAFAHELGHRAAAQLGRQVVQDLERE